MKNPFLPFLVLLALAGPLPAASFTEDEAVMHALRHNADLAAARLAIQQAAGRVTQAGRLANPELESEFKPNVRGGEGVLAFGLMQRFPLTARLRLEREASRAELAVAEAEVRDAERRVAGEVALAAVNWLALDAQRMLKERQLANSRELAAVAARVAGRGEGSGIEAVQFELEAQQLAAQVVELDADRAGLVGELRPLLGVPVAEAIEITGALPEFAATGAAEVQLAARPDYRAALARREAAERTMALARANRWQDIGVGLIGELDRSDDHPVGVQQDNFVGLRLSLPLPLWNRNEGRIAEAEATAQRAERESEALAFRIRSEVEAAQLQMLAAARLDREVGTTLLPRTTQLEERLEKLRAEGQATLMEVLRAREQRFRIESTRLDARRNFHRARVRLDTATGMILPHVQLP
ncbi:MAG: TolC family protein [Limisphaerales bacterium]